MFRFDLLYCPALSFSTPSLFVYPSSSFLVSYPPIILLHHESSTFPLRPTECFWALPLQRFPLPPCQGVLLGPTVCKFFVSLDLDSEDKTADG